jgi:MoaA/NifB/PqqE/SkfB family radical SAM enzyme
MSSFCAMPFYSQENRRFDITPCCLLAANTDVSKLKQDFLSGGRPADCQKCWNMENAGEISRRTLGNRAITDRYKCTEEQIIQDCKEGKNKIVLYQLTTSSLCDQACVTCGSYLSTKWAEVEHRAGMKTMPLFQLDLNSIDINYAEAHVITFVGGEPFFDPTTFDILRQLIEHKNYDVLISFTTNGGSQFNEQQIEIIKKFKKVGFTISIDGIESVFEYMRWPGRWDRLQSNIVQYRELGSVKVSYTVSSVNVWYYNQTAAWFKQNNLEVANLNPVYQPEWCSLKSMPAKLKQVIKNKNNALVEFCEITGQEISIETFITHIKNQDQVRGTSIEESMPEFWAVLQSLL